jgi:hypothetical protein
MLTEVRRAWRLYQTDNRADTYAALAIVAVVSLPVVKSLWEVKRKSSRG